MSSKSSVENFLAQKNIAIVGISRSGKKFGNAVNKELRAKGYNIFPVNPNADTIDGGPCYKNLSSLPQKADGVIVCIPPSQTESVVKEAHKNGIAHIWMQQGAESEAAISYCLQNSIDYVAGECILMFAEPTGFGHKLHRWVWGLLGKLPK
jgi:predicted CoA-binding protein